MSLSTRLSLFFLGALAAVLVGFSATLYLLAYAYLSREDDAHIEKALDTLEAAVDVETDGLEWEPQDRRLAVGVDPGIEHVRWVVQDRRGAIIDRSTNAAPDFPPRIGAHVLPEMPGDSTAKGDVAGWRLGRRHLRLSELLGMGKGHAEDDEPEDDIEYPDLVLTVGLSPESARTSLQRLAVALTAVSAGSWLLCATLGRWLSRRALEPVVRMAEAARGMAAADGARALPTPGTGDELDDLSRAFNALLARRREALERQTRFAGDASHQLRTPLAGLLSLVEVVRRRPRPAVEYEQALDQVRHETNRLGQIVESLLFLARSDAEAAMPEGELIDLASWIPIQLRRWSGHERGVDLQCRSSDGPVWVRAHPPLLAQAVENLVDNAIKYSEVGTPVTITCRAETGASALTVSDRGHGMGTEEAAAVFEPFYRSPEARRLGRSGVGLGLSVVYRIVAASGGRIKVESTPGHGTTFVLRFPNPNHIASSRALDADTGTLAAWSGHTADVPSLNGDTPVPRRGFDGRPDR